MENDFGFGTLADDEKIENFERSTLKLVLGQMGLSKASIRSFEGLDEGFTAGWFNDRFLAEDKLTITRIFRYNLVDILMKPQKSEVVEYFSTQLLENDWKPSAGDIVMVFKADGIGRLVATTWDKFPSSSIRVPYREAHFHITTFPGFFSSWLGTNHEDL